MLSNSSYIRLLFLAMVFNTILNTKQSVPTEIYSAVSELESLLRTEKLIIYDLASYVSAEEKRIRSIKRYYNIYKQEHNKAMEDIPEYVENPINAFKLIKQLTVDLTNIENLIKQSAKNSQNITRYHENMNYPSEEDLTGAARAITRLQKVYEISVREVASGMLFGVNNSVVMSTDDCYDLGRALYHDKDFQNGMDWLLEAYTKYLHMSVKERKMLPYNDADIKDLIANIRVDLKKKRHLLELYPAHKRPDWVKKNEIKRVIKRYEALCRGELAVPRDISKKFKCWYLRAHHPFLKYAPLKVEQVYIQPDIYIFYDVIYHDEIEELKHMTKSRFRRSLVYNPTTDKYVPVKSRICKASWYRDDESPTVERISRRVRDMTGLSTELAEELQIINYGIAGHYTPHLDFARTKDKGFTDHEGNRIATVIFYLSNVEQGGATVFTDIGVSISPIKGAAAFWWNLHRSGAGDMATKHAACPVIKGSKWIANKWLHEGGQELIRPCTLDYQPLGFMGEIPRVVKKNIR